jgi:hypothetical protein
MVAYQLVIVNVSTGTAKPIDPESGISLYNSKECLQIKEDILFAVGMYQSEQTIEKQGLFQRNKVWSEALEQLIRLENSLDHEWNEKDSACWEHYNEVWRQEPEYLFRGLLTSEYPLEALMDVFNAKVLTNPHERLVLMEHTYFVNKDDIVFYE